jgi:hypothetical protein
MDSGGKAEKSRGWILLADLGVVTTRFPEGDFFGRAGLAAFEGPAEGLERRAGFLAGLGASFVFPVGMRRTSVQIYQRSGPVGEIRILRARSPNWQHGPQKSEEGLVLLPATR